MRVPILLIAIISLAGTAAALGTGVSLPNEANSCQENSTFQCCGDIQLVFRNPDLNPKSKDDVVTAQGQLFAQFQAIGANADQITFFGFSFAPVGQAMDEEQVCAQEPWVPSGPYIINYRADTNPDDGFFINLQTTLVPDGDYMAAVHAYDSSDNEIARAWVLAEVKNCNDGATANRCDSDDYPTQEHVANDRTMPWPIMLPGDGELDPAAIDAPAEATLTLEFAEPLSELRVFLNGLLIHDKGGQVTNMTQYEGRDWDDDLMPGYGPHGLGGLVAPECSLPAPLHTCSKLGEAWYWAGRQLTDADVVRVEAVDLAGNLAKKEIHIGTGQSGAITGEFPRLTAIPDELTKTIAKGESAIFSVDLTNTGGSTAHPFTSNDAPIDKQTGQAQGDWQVNWRPHEPVQPGAKTSQELTVRPPADAPAGIYQVNGTISWNEGTEQKDRTWAFTINYGGGSGQSANTTAPEEAGDGKKSPGAWAIVPVALAVALWRRK